MTLTGLTEDKQEHPIMLIISPEARLAKQKGIVLLILASFLMVIGLTAFLATSNSSRMEITQQQTSEVKTQFAVKKAKEALMAYALTQVLTDRQLSLPCPDGGSATEGEAKPCGDTHVNKIGRLPWKTLKLNPLKDGAGECLWYAVSGDFKNSGNNEMLNQDSQGMFEIYKYNGTSKTKVSNDNDKAVAVIIAPGKRLNSQDRINDMDGSEKKWKQCGGNYDFKNYLESIDGIDNSSISSTKDALDSFISTVLPNANLTDSDLDIDADLTTDFNDYIEYITFSEIWHMLDIKSDVIPMPSNPAKLKLDNLSTFEESIDFEDKIEFEDTIDPDATPNEDLAKKLTECLVEHVFTNSNKFPWPLAVKSSDLNDDYRENEYYKRPDDYDTNSPYLGRLPCVALKEATTDCSISNSAESDGDLCSSLNQQEAFLWENWKDHFFYALSTNFDPDTTSTACADDNCIKYNGSYYAAIVFFSREALTGHLPRTNKEDIAAYLEGNNAIRYPDKYGSHTYFDGTNLITQPSYEKTGNDILYCIDATSSFGVSECP